MRIMDSLPLLKKIEHVGIVLKPESPEIGPYYEKIKSYFELNNIRVSIEKKSAEMIGIEDSNIYKLETLCQNCDFLVSIGGDGTLISVARRGFKYDIPVMGINLGHLGFLTDINPEEVKSFIEKMKEGVYRIDGRMMLEATIDDKNIKAAFNDVVVTRKSISRMVRIDAKIDGKKFNSYNGDGLVISTPTGSSAYNLACGGPIVFPLTEAVIVTPISPHSLTQRPLVLPIEFELEFSTQDKEGMVVIIDGQDIYEIKSGDSIKVTTANKKAKLIHRLERNYFGVLSQKLHWGDNSDR